MSKAKTCFDKVRVGEPRGETSRKQQFTAESFFEQRNASQRGKRWDLEGSHDLRLTSKTRKTRRGTRKKGEMA